MSIISRLTSIFGISANDHSADFPALLHTSSRGSFALQRSVLMVGDKVTQVFCSYEEADTPDLPRLVFSPDASRRPTVEAWILLIDQRGPEIVASWREWLLLELPRIERKARRYLRDGVACADFVRSLQLSTIVLSSDGSFGLRFAPAPVIGHCNLSVEFGTRGRIQEVSIGG